MENKLNATSNKMEKKSVKSKPPTRKVSLKRSSKLSSSSDDSEVEEANKSPRSKQTLNTNNRASNKSRTPSKQTDTKPNKDRASNTEKSKQLRSNYEESQDTDYDVENSFVEDSQSEDEIYFLFRGEVGERLLQSLETDFSVKFAAELYESFERSEDDDSMKIYFYKILAQNFRTIVESEDFLLVKFEFVKTLLDLDDVRIQSEIEIFDAALKWLSFDMKTRQTFANTIIGTVRFYLMDEEDYMKCIIQTDQLLDLRDILIGQEALLPSKNYKLSKKTGHFPIRNRTSLLNNHKRHSLIETKIPENIEEVSAIFSEEQSKNTNLIEDHGGENVDIICIAGFNPAKHANKNENDCKIYGFKQDKNEWFPIGKIRKARHYFSATVYNGFIYLAGGFDPSVPNDNLLNNGPVNFVIKDTFWKIDPTKNLTWETLQPMNYARAHHVLVAASGYIYAIGGQDGHGMPLDSVERYDPRSRTWKIASPLLIPCLGMAACEHNGSIWLCGGIVGTSDHNDVQRHGRIVDTVYVYNPSRNLWHFGIPLRFPRAFSNLLVFDGSLHVVGGVTAVRDFSDGIVTDVSDIDRFEPTINKWALISDLLTPRHSFSSVVTGSRLYVIGGVTSGEATKDVECYDFSLGQWLQNVQPLETPVSGFSCVVIPTTL